MGKKIAWTDPAKANRRAIDQTSALRIVHCIAPENTASQAVAQRLGATVEGQAELFGHPVDLWVTVRDLWERRA